MWVLLQVVIPMQGHHVKQSLSPLFRVLASHIYPREVLRLWLTRQNKSLFAVGLLPLSWAYIIDNLFLSHSQLDYSVPKKQLQYETLNRFTVSFPISTSKIVLSLLSKWLRSRFQTQYTLIPKLHHTLSPFLALVEKQYGYVAPRTSKFGSLISVRLESELRGATNHLHRCELSLLGQPLYQDHNFELEKL
jgi:hypothetical protein